MSSCLHLLPVTRPAYTDKQHKSTLWRLWFHVRTDVDTTRNPSLCMRQEAFLMQIPQQQAASLPNARDASQLTG